MLESLCTTEDLPSDCLLLLIFTQSSNASSTAQLKTHLLHNCSLTAPAFANLFSSVWLSISDFFNLKFLIVVQSVQLSHSVVPDSLRPHGLQHARLPCPSPTPGVDLNSCLLSRWCHPTISSSVIPFSSHLQSFPASRSFLRSQFFTSGGQRIEASASDVFPINIQDWFPYDWLIWSPCNPRDFQESSPIPQFKSISSLSLSFLYGPTLTSIHDYWKNHSFDYMDLQQQTDVSAF